MNLIFSRNLDISECLGRKKKREKSSLKFWTCLKPHVLYPQATIKCQYYSLCNAATRNKPSHLTKDRSRFLQGTEEVSMEIGSKRELISQWLYYNPSSVHEVHAGPINPPTFLPYDHFGLTEGAVDIYKVTRAEASGFLTFSKLLKHLLLLTAWRVDCGKTVEAVDSVVCLHYELFHATTTWQAEQGSPLNCSLQAWLIHNLTDDHSKSIH